MLVACLHTYPHNIAVFEAARPPGLALRHAVRTDLMERASAIGGLDAALEAETVAALLDLARGVEAVLLTSVALGPAAVPAEARAGVPVRRVDEALAAAAAEAPAPCVVLCAAEAVLVPTATLLAVSAGDRPAPRARFVPHAWAAFRRGAVEEYLALVSAAADAAYAAGAATVVLAQASMAAAAPRCRRGVPLTSPAIGLEAVVEAARRAA